MLLEYEVLNINPESEEDKKIAEFAKEVESYINSKDKFINKDTTIDTKVRNYRNIMGNITKTSYNISIEGLGLCHVEKKFEYDYTSKVFKEIYSEKVKIQPISYVRNNNKLRKKSKEKIDFYNLYKQIEKMYNISLTSEEKEIIKLSYFMGKTNQFVKCDNSKE